MRELSETDGVNFDTMTEAFNAHAVQRQVALAIFVGSKRGMRPPEKAGSRIVVRRMDGNLNSASI